MGKGGEGDALVAGMNLAVTLGTRTFEVTLRPGEGDGSWELELRGPDGPSGATPVSLHHVHGDKFLVTLGHRTSPVFIDRFNGQYRVIAYGHEFSAHVEDARLHRLREEVSALGTGTAPAEIRSPMPGLVVELEVAVGDRVREGDGVAVIESMKMENEIRATGCGIVERVLVEAGQAVDKGQTIVIIAPGGQEGPRDA